MKASARIKEKRASVFQRSTLSTDSEQWPFAVHPYTAHYRIFALQKYAAAVLRCDTASVPCIEGVSRATCNEREARSSPRRICSRILQRSHFLTQTALWRYILTKNMYGE